MTDERDEQFERLMDYYGRVVLYLRNCGFPPEDVRELAQDVYVRVYEHMGEYRGEARWSYLQKVARTVALNTIRDRSTAKRDAILESEDKLAGVSDGRTPRPDDETARRMDSRRLHLAVDRLPDNLRICVMLSLAEFSYQEIGEILGIGQAALKSRLHAAREKLRDLLHVESEGLGDGDDQ